MRKKGASEERTEDRKILKNVEKEGGGQENAVACCLRRPGQGLFPPPRQIGPVSVLKLEGGTRTGVRGTCLTPFMAIYGRSSDDFRSRRKIIGDVRSLEHAMRTRRIDEMRKRDRVIARIAGL